MTNRYCLLLCLSFLSLTGCKKPYAPKAVTNITNILVVEGLINTGSGDSTVIKLSRTVALNAANADSVEANAKVTIEDSNHEAYDLTETSPGMYTSDNLSLDNTLQYRLDITTQDGKKFMSDYLKPEASPPIDSVNFAVKSDGVQIYVSTHDPKNSTHYYRWDYIETWQFHAEYESYYVTNGFAIVARRPDQNIFYCWGNGMSNTVLLGSSAKLTQDLIYQNPITFVPSTSEKLETRYSILVKQYALNSVGYSYYTQLKENTEELGGIFDAQPTDLKGNIHCISDASIPVRGYITAGTVTQQRIFIDNRQLPNTFRTIYPYSCEEDTALTYNPKTKANEVEDLISSPAEIVLINIPGGYLYTDRDCADCSIRGTLVQPSFWR